MQIDRECSRGAGWPRAVRLGLLAQAVLVVLFAMAATVHGTVPAYSALMGGVASLLPNAWAVWRAFGGPVAQDGSDNGGTGELGSPRSSVFQAQAGRLYRAEVGKLVSMTALLVVACASVEPLNVGVMLATFVVGYVVYVLVAFGANLRSGRYH